MSHSLGEFVAGCLAGVFTLEEALTVVAGRSLLVQDLPQGAMVAVRLPEEELTPLLPEKLSIRRAEFTGVVGRRWAVRRDGKNSRSS